MSMAHECDKCGALFKSKPGCLTLGEVCVDEGERQKDGSVTLSTWYEVELCFDCSKPVLHALESSLDGLKIDKREVVDAKLSAP